MQVDVLMVNKTKVFSHNVLLANEISMVSRKWF